MYSFVLESNNFLLAQSSSSAQRLLSYNFYIAWTLLVYSLSIFLVYYITVYLYTNIQLTQSIQNSVMMKFFHMVDSEEELGSIDDTFILISVFLITFGWFFFLTLFFCFFYKTQLILLSFGALILIIFILLIPFSTLLDFGIAFPAYIRGASSSSSIVVEYIFDIIGTLVVFTRFIVQNIRFILIFLAYFELYEWIYNSPMIYTLNQLFNVNHSYKNLFGLNTLELHNNLNFYYLIILIGGIFNYMYSLIHLLILVFVQITIYLLISFWLFFFFYTSFFLKKQEKLFFYKKYY